MNSQEQHVSSNSKYYVYAPSTLAQKLYLYPLSIGHFYYESDYFIQRNCFNSFLIMYLISGSCNISTCSQSFSAKAGQFVLLNCYLPHSYGSSSAWEAIWIHFDGALAKEYYKEIISHYGHVLTPLNPQILYDSLNNIYHYFRDTSPILEPSISNSITNILNGFLLPAPNESKPFFHTGLIADSISYINEHFQQSIALEELAKNANLSRFHFSRIFSRETGFTPHQYLLHTRISAAKFLLKSTQTSVKDIAFSTGFSSECSFCTTFKKWEQLTPSEYRENIIP